MADLSNNKKLGIVGGAAATLTAVVVAAIALLGNGGNPAQFQGQPGTPQPFVTHPDYAHYDLQVHSRDTTTWDNLESEANAQHGADCSGPPTTHENHSYEGAVFICNNHLMTAIQAGGYGVIYLTPDQMVDFSQGTATIDWAMSTQINSLRDWPDWWISPWGKSLALPFENGSVDLQSVPEIGLHLTFNDSQYAPVLQTFKGCQDPNSATCVFYTWNRADSSPVFQNGIDPATNQAAVRQHFRLTISAQFQCNDLGRIDPTKSVSSTNPAVTQACNHVKFERIASSSASALTYIDTDIVALGFNSGPFTFGHHSYNPQKDGAGVPGTWHWEAPLISPAIAFTIQHAQERFTDGGTIHFAQPAPANAYLHFGGICNVSVDGAGVQPQTLTIHPDHFASYFVPVPQGATQFDVEFTPAYQGPCRAQDFALWSQNSGAVSSATPALPTTTPTVTPTATVVGSTPVPTATSSPVPATATPAATNTPAPRATPTIVPIGPISECTLRWGNKTIIDYGKIAQNQCTSHGIN